VTEQTKIRVAIVDDNAEQRKSLTLLLGFEDDIEVVGEAATGAAAVELAMTVLPNIVLMDINLPDMDGIRATDLISRQTPGIDIIMMSIQGDPDYLRRSMLAGARNFLVKPFSSDELTSVIRQVHGVQATRQPGIRAIQQVAAEHPQDGTPEQGSARVFAVFSPKGGAGCTSTAVNLAVAIKQLTGKRVALVDAHLLFGDVAVLLNLHDSKSIYDLARIVDQIDDRVVRQTMTQHGSGVSVLTAPPTPELSEQVTPEVIKQVMETMSTMFDYIVVDTYPSFADTTLAVFDAADRILVLMTLEMTSLKNIRLFLEVTDKLRYPKDKVAIVVNRFDRAQTIKMEHIEGSLRRTVDFRVSNNPTLSTLSINQGVPYVQSSRDSQLAHEILDIAGKLTRSSVEADAPDLGAPRPAPKMSTRFSFLGRRG